MIVSDCLAVPVLKRGAAGPVGAVGDRDRTVCGTRRAPTRPRRCKHAARDTRVASSRRPRAHHTSFDTPKLRAGLSSHTARCQALASRALPRLLPPSCVPIHSRPHRVAATLILTVSHLATYLELVLPSCATRLRARNLSEPPRAPLVSHQCLKSRPRPAYPRRQAYPAAGRTHGHHRASRTAMPPACPLASDCCCRRCCWPLPLPLL